MNFGLAAFVALAYESQAQYQKALDRLNLALKLFREAHDKENEATVLALIAQIEQELKESKKRPR